MHDVEGEGTVDLLPLAHACESAVSHCFAELHGKLAQLQKELAEEFQRTVAHRERHLETKIRRLREELAALREQPRSPSESDEAQAESKEQPRPSTLSSKNSRALLVSSFSATPGFSQTFSATSLGGANDLLHSNSMFDMAGFSQDDSYPMDTHASMVSAKSRSSHYSHRAVSQSGGARWSTRLRKSIRGQDESRSCLRKSNASICSKVVKISADIERSDEDGGGAGAEEALRSQLMLPVVSNKALPSPDDPLGGGKGRLTKELGYSVRSIFNDPGKQASRLYRGQSHAFGEDDKSGMAASKYVIMPNCRFRLLFEMLIICALSYDAIMTPWILAWNPRALFFTVVSLVTFIFWTIDMVLNFFTGFFRAGECVLELRAIATNYLKTWFAADFAVNAIDCASLICEFFERDTSTSMSAGTLMMRAMRLIKVNKLLRVIVFVKRSAERTAGTLSGKLQFIGLGTKLVITLLWLNHVISCVWFYIGDAGWSDTGHSWLDMQPRTGEETYRDVGKLYQYCTSLHWAITQMTPGSMSVVPQNSTERLFNVVCLFVGLFVGALLVSQLSARMVKVQLENQEHIQRMGGLQTYLRENNIGWRLRARVQQQILERRKLKKRLTAKEVPMLDHLSTSLRRELSCTCFANQVMTHTLFNAWGALDARLVESICMNAVQLVVLSQDDDLFTPLSVCENVYDILKGTMKYTAEEDDLGNDTIVTSGRDDLRRAVKIDSQDKDVVHAGTWVCEAALWLDWSYSGTLTSLTECELLALHVPSLLGLLKKHPKVRSLNYHYCNAFCRMLLSEPDGYHDLSTNYEHLLMMLALEWRLEIMTPLATEIFNQHYGINDFMGWRRGSTSMDALNSALVEGKAVVSMHYGRPTVFALGVDLRITRCDGRESLVCLAEDTDGELVAKPRLPRTRLGFGETPPQAALRVLHTDLPVFQYGVVIEGVETDLQNASREVFDASSAHYNVLAKRMTSTVTASLQDADYAVSHPNTTLYGRMPKRNGTMVKKMSAVTRISGVMRFPSISRANSDVRLGSQMEDITEALNESECFLVRGLDGEAHLYGWFGEVTFQSFKSLQGLEALRWWLASNEGRFGEASSKLTGFSV